MITVRVTDSPISHAYVYGQGQSFPKLRGGTTLFTVPNVLYTFRAPGTEWIAQGEHSSLVEYPQRWGLKRDTSCSQVGLNADVEVPLRIVNPSYEPGLPRCEIGFDSTHMVGSVVDPGGRGVYDGFSGTDMPSTVQYSYRSFFQNGRCLNVFWFSRSAWQFVRDYGMGTVNRGPSSYATIYQFFYTGDGKVSTFSLFQSLPALNGLVTYQGRTAHVDNAAELFDLAGNATVPATSYAGDRIIPYIVNGLDGAALANTVLGKLATYDISSAFVSSQELEIPWGDMSIELLNQVRPVDKSLLFLVFDFGDLSALISKWKSAGLFGTAQHFTAWCYANGKRVTSRKALKLYSRLYLTWTYGVRSCISDVKRLYDGLTKRLFRASFLRQEQRLHTRRQGVFSNASGQVVSYTAVLTAVLDRFPTGFVNNVQELIARLKGFGIYPSVTDLWDILPYSFVVDWFVDFGGTLEAVSADMDLRDYFPIQYAISSEKYMVSVTAHDLLPEYVGASGDGTIKYYYRMVTRELTPPIPSIERGTLLSDRWVEASALVVQRMKTRST